jgi:hypothetical protein
MSNKLALCALLLVAFVFSASVSVDAQKRKVNGTIGVFEPIAEANPAASLEQCRNGDSEPGVGCVNSANGLGWVTGNAGFQNSHWAEYQFLPYRMLFSNLQIGVQQTVTIGYDILKDDVHAIDYLGTYNATETLNDPCFGVAGCSFAPGDYSAIAVPEDTVTVTSNINPNTGLNITQLPGEIRMWGGVIDSIAYEPYAGGDERRVTIVFTPSVPNPVMAWSGHVAWQGDWGAGNSAGGISGSPYHMRLIDLNGQGGNQDRSLSADAVDVTGALIIVKEVETFDNLDASDVAFTFTASAFFPNPMDPQNIFTLTDDNDGPGVDRRQSGPIFATSAVTVVESAQPGFDLLDITCDDADSVGNVAARTLNANVSVSDAAGEIVTCTFSNGLLVPTAAPASITGRVLDRYGRGIYGARVQLFNASTGAATTAVTNTFGYYRFSDVPVGDFYVMSVTHKRYTFVNGSTSFSLDADLAGVDFIASN